MANSPPMTLVEALWILERAHTRDHPELGYVVELQQAAYQQRAAYVEAWGVVRTHLRQAKRDPKI